MCEAAHSVVELAVVRKDFIRGLGHVVVGEQGQVPALCIFCGDGQLIGWRCASCDSVVALCDECELIWSNPRSLLRDASRLSDGNFPVCPICKGDLRDGRQEVIDGAAG